MIKLFFTEISIYTFYLFISKIGGIPYQLNIWS